MLNVYRGKDNPSLVRFEIAEEPIDFTHAVSMELLLNTSVPILVDTLVTPSAITWEDTTGIVTFNLGSLIVDHGTVASGTLTVIDRRSPDGQVLVRASTQKLRFKFHE